jgi:hypothetical protein
VPRASIDTPLSDATVFKSMSTLGDASRKFSAGIRL